MTRGLMGPLVAVVAGAFVSGVWPADEAKDGH
jgi:hypothetical protein